MFEAVLKRFQRVSAGGGVPLEKKTRFADGFLSQVTFHRSQVQVSNCAPKRNMFLLKIYIRAYLVLLALLRLFYAVLGQILSDL